MMAVIGMTMMAGGFVGAGISSSNTIKTACDNAKQAKDLFLKNKELQDKWTDIFSKEAALDVAIVGELHDLNSQIIKIQNTIKKNLDELKKTKKTVVIIGFCMVIAIFFALIIKYFLKLLQQQAALGTS